MTDIFQFIKYYAGLSSEKIRKIGESGVVICFDLEDSISDWVVGNEASGLKSEYRIVLNRILCNLNAEQTDLKIGIRINALLSGQQKSDIDSIPPNSKVHSILIPKVEDKTHIDMVVEQLTSKNIYFEEIVPIIETKKGIENLVGILNSTFHVQKVGFGHCDYNLSIGIFPFFHQDSIEYWKWVSQILRILKPLNIRFINSAFLQLTNDVFFNSMLAHLQSIYPDSFGQFTLSHQQTMQCKVFAKQAVPSERIGKSRLNHTVDKMACASFVSAFELENTGQGFSITSDKSLLVSPHEYCAAKQMLRNWKKQDVNFSFVGGCFPVQDNILFEDIFHQTLKKKVEERHNVNFNIRIVRYELFSTCLQKVIDHSNNNAIDYLVFHVRPEPFLRLVKIFYKYSNYDNKLCRSLNIPFLKKLKPEKFDILLVPGRFIHTDAKSRSKLYSALINLNYFLGFLIGNHRYARKRYLHLCQNTIKHCNDRKIELIILGPALRSNTFAETILSRKLEKLISTSLKNMTFKYVSGLKKHTENGQRFFASNGIHATKLYHDLIASRLFELIDAGLYGTKKQCER
ncbi:MAG: hypothetical protein KKD31_19230 [Bacteroidetes bacterium]|nr:hypothetical protein [Bacteroidota bacterium]